MEVNNRQRLINIELGSSEVFSLQLEAERTTAEGVGGGAAAGALLGRGRLRAVLHAGRAALILHLFDPSLREEQEYGSLCTGPKTITASYGNRPDKYLAQPKALTLIVDLDIGARVQKSVHDTPSSNDAEVFEVSLKYFERI